MYKSYNLHLIQSVRALSEFCKKTSDSRPPQSVGKSISDTLAIVNPTNDCCETSSSAKVISCVSTNF